MDREDILFRWLERIALALEAQVTQQERANGMTERMLMNQEKAAAMHEQLRDSSQRLELKLMDD